MATLCDYCGHSFINIWSRKNCPKCGRDLEASRYFQELNSQRRRDNEEEINRRRRADNDDSFVINNAMMQSHLTTSVMNPKASEPVQTEAKSEPSYGSWGGDSQGYSGSSDSGSSSSGSSGGDGGSGGGGGGD